MKTHDFRRCHPKTAGKKSVGGKYSVQKAPSQNCSWKTCGWKVFSSEGAIPKLQVKNPDIKYHPKTADENSCVRKVPSQNWRPNTESPPMPLAARHWFQKVQNPDPNKLHNASKSCSRQQTPTKKAEEPNSTKTHKWSMWFCCSCFNVQMHNFGTWTLRAIAQMNYCIKTDAKK